MRRFCSALLVLVLTASAATATGACESAGAREAVLRALAETKAAKTTAYSIKVEALSVTAEQPSTSTTIMAPVTLSVTGSWDMAKDLLRSTLAYSGGGKNVDVEYIVVKGTVYIREAGRGGLWGKEPQGGDDLDSLGVIRPDLLLETLTGVTDSMKKVGSQKIAGTSTTHYRGVADLGVAAKEAEADARASLAERAKDTKGATAKVDLWVDEQGRIRRIVTSTVADDGKSTYRTTFDLKSLGVPVRIEAPPDAEIAPGNRIGERATRTQSSSATEGTPSRTVKRAGRPNKSITSRSMLRASTRTTSLFDTPLVITSSM